MEQAKQGVSAGAFARLCGCSKQYISRQRADDRLNLDARGGILVNDAENLEFRAEVIENRVNEMLETGEVLPRWACLVAVVGEKPVPLIFYVPEPLFDGEMVLTDEAEDFKVDGIDLEVSDLVERNDGTRHRLILVTRGEARPPWLQADKRKAAARG